MNLKDHWDSIFKETDAEELGWHEKDFTQSLKFLNLVPDWESSKIFIAGVGTSGLVGTLLKSRAKLVLNDISPEAIGRVRSNHDDPDRVQWLCQDISDPLPPELNDVDIWFDRAVLHFLVEERKIEGYFRNVNAAVKAGGYAVFAEFSKTGAPKCAGLDVRRYDVRDLCARLPGFDLVANEDYTYVNPWGAPRPYIYALFKRIVQS